mmetsp:Transcript_26760/g.65602  ORF Transcript_26760/g.65602 Transcript_26760/m.65602 type:complete len:95 (-) Transcript_26760:33-317(-)
MPAAAVGEEANAKLCGIKFDAERWDDNISPAPIAPATAADPDSVDLPPPLPPPPPPLPPLPPMCGDVTSPRTDGDHDAAEETPGDAAAALDAIT